MKGKSVSFKFSEGRTSSRKRSETLKCLKEEDLLLDSRIDSDTMEIVCRGLRIPMISTPIFTIPRKMVHRDTEDGDNELSEDEANVMRAQKMMMMKMSKHLTYIPPSKLKLSGHKQSYNPSLEYIPTEEGKASYELMYKGDRPKFIPKRFTSLRSIPAYENELEEYIDLCLDLYLYLRVRKKRLST